MFMSIVRYYSAKESWKNSGGKKKKYGYIGGLKKSNDGKKHPNVFTVTIVMGIICYSPDIAGH